MLFLSNILCMTWLRLSHNRWPTLVSRGFYVSVQFSTSCFTYCGCSSSLCAQRDPTNLCCFRGLCCFGASSSSRRGSALSPHDHIAIHMVQNLRWSFGCEASKGETDKVQLGCRANVVQGGPAATLECQKQVTQVTSRHVVT